MKGERGLLRRLGVSARALVLLLALGSPARADEPSASDAYVEVEAGGDVIGGLEALPSMLPDPPRGFRRRSMSGADYTFPAHYADDIESLDRSRAKSWQLIVDDLGVVPLESVVVRIARNPEEMHRLAPRGMPPPSYASGVAYPAFGLVLLTLTTHNPDEPVPNVRQVLAHELSHVAVHRAAGGRPLPRWFSEGMAIHHSSENNLPRMQVLWEATSQGRLLPLTRLSQGFADRSQTVDVAYAQSADVIAFLLRETHGPDKIRRLLTNVRNGKTFEQALEDSFFYDLRELERRWRADLDERHSRIPLVLGGGGLWALAIVAIGIGYLRKRRVNKATLVRWANQEAAIDSLEAELARKLEIAEKERQERTAALAQAREDEPVGPDDAAADAAREEPNEDVPTITKDGTRHTLH